MSWVCLRSFRLQEGDFTTKEKKRNVVKEAVGFAYWGVLTAIFLTWSFLTNHWHISWLVFAIGGVLFPIVMLLCNLIALSDEFGLSLDELIKENTAVKKKLIADSSAKKWHILIIMYLLAIVAYVTYFAICHNILMIGFLIATLFMLLFELGIFVKEKIYCQK